MQKYLVMKNGMLCRKDGKTILMTEKEAIERASFNNNHVQDYTFYKVTPVTPVNSGWRLE